MDWRIYGAIPLYGLPLYGWPDRAIVGLISRARLGGKAIRFVEMEPRSRKEEEEVIEILIVLFKSGVIKSGGGL